MSEFIHLIQQPQNESTRVFVLLHGTGGDESSLIPFAKTIDPNAGFLAIRGAVLENGAPRFFRRLAEGVFDMEDLHLQTKRLAEFIERHSAEQGWSPKDMVALGYSNGANIASSILLSGITPFHNAILLRGMVPFVPTDKADLTHSRVLISSGQFDPIVPVDQPKTLESLFTDRGAKTQLVWHPVDHRLSRGDLEAISGWL